MNLTLGEQGQKLLDERIMPPEAGVAHNLAVPAGAVAARAGLAAWAQVVPDLLAGSADAQGDGCGQWH
jgi:hypothetical protein